MVNASKDRKFIMGSTGRGFSPGFNDDAVELVIKTGRAVPQPIAGRSGRRTSSRTRCDRGGQYALAQSTAFAEQHRITRSPGCAF